jgi:D-alanine--poly(phosphoribitol) ligase subunit 1
LHTLYERFLSVCKEFPEQAAVETAESIFTYSELNATVTQLTETLRSAVSPGQAVIYDDDRPESLLVLLLACSRLSITAVPLPNSLPPRHRKKVETETRPICRITFDASDLSSWSLHTDDYTQPRNDLTGHLYILYTSGSTGQPKGICIPEASLVARLDGFVQTVDVAPRARILGLTSVSFDISFAEILTPLFVGGTLVTPPAYGIDRLYALKDFLSLHSVDAIQSTPSVWRLLLALGIGPLPHTTAWSCGEPMTEPLAASLLKQFSVVWNLYGPTEATIYASAWKVTAGSKISLGESLPGTYFNIASTDQSEQELVISGVGLASGYLDQPTETSRVFVPGTPGLSPRESYRTGDLVQLLADGRLQFLGRLDDQIKVAGQRYEIGAIEQAVELCLGEGQAVVVQTPGTETHGSKLAAFVRCDGEYKEDALHQKLLEHLPDAAIPASFTNVDSFPLMASGKIDRKLLKSRFQ